MLGSKMEPCWHQNSIKIRSYVDNAAKPNMLIKPIETQWFFGFRGSKLGAKIDQKSIYKWIPKMGCILAAIFEGKIDQTSIKKCSHDGKASWNRFFIDFGGFGEVSWHRKSRQDQSKKASKKRRKKEGRQGAKKVATRGPNHPGHQGSRTPGRSPPLRRGNPLGPPGWAAWPLKSSKVL